MLAFSTGGGERALTTQAKHVLLIDLGGPDDTASVDERLNILEDRPYVIRLLSLHASPT